MVDGLVIKEVWAPQAEGVIDCLSSLYDPPVSGEVWGEVYRHQMGRGATLYGACLAGEVVGACCLWLSRSFGHGGAWVGRIEDVAVRKDYRRRGVGKAMVTHCVGVARRKRCYKVYLNCWEGLVPFYRSCGFTQAGVVMRMDLGDEQLSTESPPGEGGGAAGL